MDKITFEVSALKESNNVLVDHFEVKFSESVNGQWLYEAIEKALKNEVPMRKPRKEWLIGLGKTAKEMNKTLKRLAKEFVKCEKSVKELLENWPMKEKK